MKKNYEILSSLLAPFLIFLMRIFSDSQGSVLSEYWFFILATIIVVVIHFVLNSFFKNAIFFSFGIYLLFGIFPFMHYLIYKNDKKSYNYESYYLQYKANLSKDKMNHYSSINILKDIKTKSSDSLLSLNPHELLHRQLIQTQDYIITTQYHYDFGKNHPDIKAQLDIYLKSGKMVSSIDINDAENIQGAINNYINKYNEVLNETKEPEKYLLISDFWLESITGFIFGDIKPLSTFAKLIRILQLLVSIIFSLLIGNSFSSFNKFKLENKYLK
jgi:hypothetical protein